MTLLLLLLLVLVLIAPVSFVIPGPLPIMTLEA